MKLKKFLAIIMAILMLCLCTGCGDEGYIDSLSTFSVTSRDKIELPSAEKTTDEESSSSSTIAIPNETFGKGTLNGTTYINNWANLKFDFYGGFENGDSSAYSSCESAKNTYCGLIAIDNANKKQLNIIFEELTGTNTSVTVEEYIEVITGVLDENYKSMNTPYEFGETFNQTIANENYRSFIVTFSELNYIQHISVRKLDNYIILITTIASDSFDSSAILNNIRTMY